MKPSSFAILTLVHLAIPHAGSKKARYPPELVNQVLQVILREALDVSSPLSHLRPQSSRADRLPCHQHLQPYEDLTLEELMQEIRSFGPAEGSRRMEAEAREVVSPRPAEFIRPPIAH